MGVSTRSSITWFPRVHQSLERVQTAGSTPHSIDVDVTTSRFTVSERFVSVTIDIFAIGNQSGRPCFGIEKGDARWNTLAAGLAPAHLRIGGTGGDFTTYASTAAPTPRTKQHASLTPGELACVSRFAHDAGWEVNFGLNANAGFNATPAHRWDPRDALELLKVRDARSRITGFRRDFPSLRGVSLGNEPNIKCDGAKAFTPSLLARSFRRLLQIAGTGKHRLHVGGPDVSLSHAEIAKKWRPGAPARFLGEFTQAMQADGLFLDALTWHHYYPRPIASVGRKGGVDMLHDGSAVDDQISRSFVHPTKDESPGACLFARNFCDHPCPTPISKGTARTYDEAALLTPQVLDDFLHAARAVSSIHRAYRRAAVAQPSRGAKKAPPALVLSESGGPLGLGYQPADRLAAALWTFDKLGIAAATGHAVVARQQFDVLVGRPAIGEAPEPSTGYWAMHAFKKFVDRRVLRVTRGLMPGRWLRVYAFCARPWQHPRRGGAMAGDVALVAINLQRASRRLNVTGPLQGLARNDLIFDTGRRLNATRLLLNGAPLTYDGGPSLPALVPLRRRRGSPPARLPPLSASIIVYRGAHAPACEEFRAP